MTDRDGGRRIDALPTTPQTRSTIRTSGATRSVACQVVWAVLSLGIGVPSILGIWIGLVILGDRLGWGATANEIFAWILAMLVALVLWPTMVRYNHRHFVEARDRQPGSNLHWGEPTRPVPKVVLSCGERCARAVTSLLGGASLVVVCGPQQVMLGVLDTVSAGPHSWWGALQFMTSLLLFMLMMPALWFYDRSLRHYSGDAPGRVELEIRKSWYVAAAGAWVMCAMVDFVFGSMVVKYL